MSAVGEVGVTLVEDDVEEAAGDELRIGSSRTLKSTVVQADNTSTERDMLNAVKLRCRVCLFIVI